MKIENNHRRIDLPTQHTPNPDAQLPVAVPPLLEHSDEVKHVPLRPVDVVQGALENRTMENNDMTEIIQNINRVIQNRSQNSHWQMHTFRRSICIRSVV